MTVKELMAALKQMNPNAYVVINNTTVGGLEEVKGTLDQEHFRCRERGKDRAVRFTHSKEGSDGAFYQSPYWFGDPHD